jgi:hypothetical protein
MSEVYIEKRKRGFFGWLFLIVFILWNALMVLFLISMIMTTNNLMQTTAPGGESTGTAIGVGFSFIMLIIVWALGSVITGLLALVTRGSKTMVKKI